MLDINIVVSTLVFGGDAAARIRRAWRTGACVPLASAATVHELIRVLVYPKFRLDIDEQEELLGDYLPFAQTVTIPVPPPVLPTCRDPFDQPLVELAFCGKARALVSGDRDLHALAARLPFPIPTLEAFARTLPATGSISP